MKIFLLILTLIPFISGLNWTGNYTQWGLQPFNSSIHISNCCNASYVNITHTNTSFTISMNFTTNSFCPNLKGPVIFEESLLPSGLVFYDQVNLNGIIGEYVPTNSTLAISVNNGNCVWLLGNNNSKITNIAAYQFEWGGNWILTTTSGVYTSNSQCCLPQFPLKILYDDSTQTINYSMQYKNNSLINMTINSNTTINNATTTTNNQSVNVNSANSCPNSLNGLNYTYNTSITGGSFFDPVSSFIGFSLPNGSILLQSQSCFLILQLSSYVLFSFNIIIFIIAVIINILM